MIPVAPIESKNQVFLSDHFSEWKRHHPTSSAWKEILFDSMNLESCFQQWPSAPWLQTCIGLQFRFFFFLCHFADLPENGENFEMTMSNQNMEFFFGDLDIQCHSLNQHARPPWFD